MRSDSMKAYFRDINKIPLLSKEEEVFYAREVKKGCLKSKEKMITANLRLVAKIAGTRHKSHPDTDIADMIAEGNMGLMHAVEKFDPELGFKFSTYATNWIIQYIERGILNKEKTIRIPVHCYRDMWKVSRAVAFLSKESGKSFFQEKEIFDYLTAEGEEDITVPRIRAALFHMMQKQVSIFDPIKGKNHASSESNAATYQDMIEAETDEISQGDTEASNKLAVEKCLSVLSKENREIMMRRFGIGGYEESTLEEISKFFDVTRERIRQRIVASIRAIRTNPTAQTVLAEIFQGGSIEGIEGTILS